LDHIITVGAPLETSLQQIFASRDFVYFVYCIMSNTPPSRDRLKQQLEDCDLLSGTDVGTLDRVKHHFALQHAKQINETTDVFHVKLKHSGT
jgi:hypothetical protein